MTVLRQMSRAFVVLLLALSPAVTAVVRAQAPPPPRKGFGKKGPRRMPPGTRLDALERMTPDQQERFLNNLPPPRRAEARRMLDKWRQMTPEERLRARQTLGEFRGLPPERQRRVRMLFGQFNSLPADRQPVLRNELAELRRMDPEESKARMNSEEFRSKFSAQEQRLLSDLTDALPHPLRDEQDEREQ